MGGGGGAHNVQTEKIQNFISKGKLFCGRVYGAYCRVGGHLVSARDWKRPLCGQKSKCEEKTSMDAPFLVIRSILCLLSVQTGLRNPGCQTHNCPVVV